MVWDALLALWFALLGLALGSFLNVAIVRLPPRLLAQEQGLPLPKATLWAPRSHCPHCGHPLGWHELWPVLSFAWQRGRCRHCAAPLSWQYPLMELAAAACLLLALAWHGPGPAALAWGAMSAVLVALAVIDLRTRFLPNALTWPLIAGGVLASAAGWTGVGTLASLAGAALGGAALWAVARGFEWRSGRVGLGDGDIWLLAALGAWTGPAPLPGTVLLGALAGLLYAGLLKALRRWPEDGYIPFGPALMLGAALHAGLGVPAFLRP